MKKRLALIVAVTMAALASFGATSASAATEFGNTCSATGGIFEATFVQLSKNPGSPPPLAAPSAGVITSWKVNVGIPLEGKTYPSKLDVFRSAGGANSFTLVGQSSPALVGQTGNSFATRIPVQAGDRLGFGGGENVQWYCETGNPLDVLGYLKKGDVPLGGTQTFPEEAEGIQEAVAAVIEPDADGDGFGDETQDACPQSAATQAPCPAVILSTSTQIKKGSVIVTVTTNTAAPVTVKGVVPLGKGKKAKLKGSTKNLAAGVGGKFTLKLAKAVKAKLADLSRSQSLTLKATVTGTSLAGQVTTKKLKVKLKGQGSKR